MITLPVGENQKSGHILPNKHRVFYEVKYLYSCSSPARKRQMDSILIPLACD